MPDETEVKKADSKEEKANLEVQSEDGVTRGEWLPSGIITFEDFDAMEEANKQALQVKNDASLFKAIIDNILELEPSEGQDKQQMIRDLANSFADRMDSPILKEKDRVEDKDVTILEGASIDDQGKWNFTQPFLDGLKNLLGINKEVKKETTPGFSVWKSQDGQYHWLAAYSNNFRDDDNPPEIISSQSHKEFDEALSKGEWPMPELWLWHVPYAVGKTLYHAYDESTGFVVAGGMFNKGMEWAAEGVIEAEWDGVSHSMPTTEIQRDKDDKTIITRHRTKEISPLPNWAAANKLAFNIVSKENEQMANKGLSPEKRQEFVQAFGEKRVTEMEETLSGKAQEAKDAGVESKEKPKTKFKSDEELVAGLEANEAPLTRKELFEALALIVDEVKSLKTELAEVKEQAEKEEPQDLVAMLETHRAIGNETAKVDGRTKEARDIPQETEVRLHEIGILDRIMKANQAVQ